MLQLALFTKTSLGFERPARKKRATSYLHFQTLLLDVFLTTEDVWCSLCFDLCQTKLTSERFKIATDQT